MTTETKIRTKDVADDTSLRSLEISIGRAKIMTPSKSLGADLVSPNKVMFPNTGTQFNEIYKTFTPESLIKIRNDQPTSRKKNLEFQKLRDNVPNSPAISFIDYKVKEGERLIPTDAEINTLTNFAYTYSDITPIPALPNFVTSINHENYDDFRTYLKKSIESIEIWNHKPIMGYLPFVGVVFLEDIIDLYVEHGINAYYLDFNRKGFGDLTAITAIKKQLGTHDLQDNHFIHFINMDYGKVNKEINVLPAKDFLGFGHGLDSMGNSHRPKGFSKKEGQLPSPLPPKKYRVFDREGYGYYRIEVANLEHKETPYPEKAVFSREMILHEKTKVNKDRMMGLVNLQEQTTECSQLQLIAAENVKHSFEYFATKPCLDKKDLKKIKR